MKHLIPVLACAAVLWTAAASAGPLKPAAPPAQGYLSPSEVLCGALGTFAHSRTMDRDNGFALTYVLSRVRQWDAQNGVEPSVRAYHDHITKSVYASPGLRPANARQLTEVACIEQSAKTTMAPKPGETLLRY